MKDISNTEIRYVRPGSRSPNPLQSFVLAFKEIWQSRYIIWQLFKRDFAAQFQQRILGYLWVILGPLVAIASFVFLNLTGVLKPGPIGLTYVVFALTGSIFWSILVSSITSLSNALIGQSDLITRTNVPKLALAISSTANLFYIQLINFFIVLIFSFLMKDMPTVGIFLYPFLLAPLFLLGVGVGFVISIVNVIARDVSSVFAVFLQLMMFLCPVAYMPNFQNQYLITFMKYNPLYYLIQFPREVIYFLNFEHLSQFLLSSLFCSFIFVIGLHGFYLIEDKVAERL